MSDPPSTDAEVKARIDRDFTPGYAVAAEPRPDSPRRAGDDVIADAASDLAHYVSRLTAELSACRRDLFKAECRVRTLERRLEEGRR